MRTVFTNHIMQMAGINEIIGICIRIHTGFQESQAVLPNNNRIDISVDQQQMSLQITCFQFQVGIPITFRIVLRTVHIALAIHNLVVAPVDHRTTGNPHFEQFRIRTHQVRRHKAAVAPSVHTDTVGIDIRK